MLRADQLVAGYVGAAVVKGVSLTVASGEVFSLLGSNGAGKSTVAKVLAGILRTRSGRVEVDGKDVTNATANQRVRSGVSLVPEARHLFAGMSVRDNLLLGGYTRPRRERAVDLDEVVELFPQLDRLLSRKCGTLSGGEQQMVAFGRALMARPRYLILDEPSLGLAPLYVDVILAKARELAARGLGVLLIEQNVRKALAVSDRGAVIATGEITLRGSAVDLSEDANVIASYFGAMA